MRASCCSWWLHATIIENPPSSAALPQTHTHSGGVQASRKRSQTVASQWFLKAKRPELEGLGGRGGSRTQADGGGGGGGGRGNRNPWLVFHVGANIRLAAALTHQRSLIWRTQSSLNYREIRAGLGRRWESGLESGYYIQQRRQWLAPVAAQPRARGHVTISWTGSVCVVFFLCVFFPISVFFFFLNQNLKLVWQHSMLF